MQVSRDQVKRSECSQEVIGAMEDFLWTLIGSGNRESIVSRLMACGDYAKPYLDVVNGNDLSNTISAAVSYYQYVRLVRGEVRINRDYLADIDDDLVNPATVYSYIVDRMTHALKAQDYVTAGFLADLAFIARSYMLCVSNGGSCDWIRRAFKVRVLILRRFSNY
ncbi:hypothetical protein Vdis_1669 [Vulcanisaeta distributa DSM 14429]|uniref:Uncharacterized protein n=2 Tax=Vulcanisaeta distributa TaxID=164451 RepID=E1QU53_VULDI|nr:hypothetical protein Vdis_1669 [Vulcanisaeta distributa DSM 14429]